jgi:hypothetical protein
MRDLLANQKLLDAFFTSMTGVMAAGTLVLVFTIIRRFFREPTLVAYRVGVIGLPRAGKTSLIGAVFSEIFKSSMNPRTRLSGSKTISRVNRIISSLDQGTEVPPTKEGDTFVFRFIYLARRVLGFVPFKYEVEIADFPGEYSSELLEAAEETVGLEDDQVVLLDREYVGWLTNSRVLIFVIEAPPALHDPGSRFAAETKAQIRATWQSLKELRSDRGLSGARVRVALVFTKCDALVTGYEADHISLYLNEKEAAEVDGFCSELSYKYFDLINFLRSDAYFVTVHFTSAYAQTPYGRFGLPDLVRGILPR